MAEIGEREEYGIQGPGAGNPPLAGVRPSSSSSAAEAEAEAEPETANNLIPSLPDDIALNCLARVPPLQYPTLSLVSKPFRTLLKSPLFFTTRSLLNCTQPLLYLTLRSPSPDTNLQWFTLHRTATKPILCPLPPSPTPVRASAYAVLGPTIYVIGGSIRGVPSSDVWLFDCRFRRWLRGPSMHVAREFAAAGVVAGKIYVFGGCIADTWTRSAYWAEVLDLAAGRWECVPSLPEFQEKRMHCSAVVGGKVYLTANRGSMAFEPSSGAWESVAGDLDLGLKRADCVVKGILYSYHLVRNIEWFDVRRGVWEELKGLEKALPKFLSVASMVDLGGKLCVVWQSLWSGKEMEIWCAEIGVEKNGDGELWGQLGWLGKILSVPKGSAVLHCSSVAL